MAKDTALGAETISDIDGGNELLSFNIQSVMSIETQHNVQAQACLQALKPTIRERTEMKQNWSTEGQDMRTRPLKNSAEKFGRERVLEGRG